VICILFALLTSASNASAAVLQRRAAAQVPEDKSLHLSLITTLARKKIWLAGIGMVVVAALFQAAALATGPIALVQPIFIIELPLTLLLSTVVMGYRLSQIPWLAVAVTTVGLAAGLACANPSGGTDRAPNTTWVLALIAAGAFEAVIISTAVPLRGEARAALLGLAAACGYALTAALLKNAVAELDQGPAQFFRTWQLYGVAVAGVGALFLLQNALQAGTLVASQPMLTVGDALISISFGVTIFGEAIRVGWWLVPELIALAMIIVGCVYTAKSPLAAATTAPPPVASRARPRVQ